MATIKQKKTVRKIAENVRNDKSSNIGEILQESGYSKSVSESPTKVTQSKGFIELLEKSGLSDEELLKVHKEGLSATNLVGQPEYAIRHKYLDTAYKIKGSYAPEKADVKLEGLVIVKNKK